MSRVKDTVNFIHAWQHPDEIADEVEAELRFHVQMRTNANIEQGMTPHEAEYAARQSFGNFNEIKASCCEIKRDFPINLKPIRIALYIALACLAGGVALVAVNLPHHNPFSLLWQLVPIAVLMRLLLIGRRKQ
jgi:hypothetical protein